MRITGKARTALIVLGVLGVAALGFILGGMVMSGTPSGAPGYGGAGTVESSLPPAGSPDALTADKGVAPQDYGAVTAPEAQRSGVTGTGDTAGVDAMIVRNNSLDMRVDSIEPALNAIRNTAKRFGATITDLSVSGGNNGGVPVPLSADIKASGQSYPSPAFASMVIRVDASKLDALQAEVSKVGKVLTEGGSASDVTQEYVDLTARLKNLQATEATLRGFYDKAKTVSDLLKVEAELSRVRGEIEALQAQTKYLERQTARATLTVSLTEPGPIVQPSGNDWGFSEAIRRGIQSAATLVTGLITLVIAIAPIIIGVLVVWLVVRWARKRRTPPAAGDQE